MKYKHDEIKYTSNDTQIKINNAVYKLTQWSSWNPYQTPVRKGIYQIRDSLSGYVYFAIWNGKAWRYRGSTIDWVLNPKVIGDSPVQRPMWRGILK